MEDTIKIRKDKVKNAAIVFLSIMLILTFFSNSILNRALPEVATAYVEYNTITEKVRGSGTVVADDPYKVVVKDTRTIESVAVMVGDEVTKDQVLFYLEDAESEELETLEEEIKAKEEELSQQVLDYMTSLLSVDISNMAYQNIQNDNISSAATYQAQIESSRQKVEEAQGKVDSLNRQILLASTESSEEIDVTTELATAEANKEAAATRKAEAQAKVDSIQAQVASLETKMAEVLGKDITTDSNNDGNPDDPATVIQTGIAEVNTALNAAINDTEGKKNAYETAKQPLVELLKKDYPPADGTDSGSTDTGAEKVPALTDAQVNAYFTADGFPKMDKIDALEKAAKEHGDVGANGGTIEFQKMKSAYMTYLDAVDKKNELQAIYDAYFNLPGQLSAAKKELADAEDDYDDYVDEIEDLSEASAMSAGDKTEWQNALKLSLADAEAALATAQKEQEQLLKDIGSELALSDKNDEISDTEEELEKLQTELEELREELTGATITAPVDGTIISLEKTAGESTVPEEAVATIQVAGKGMMVSFSVTNAQAAKVNVGDKAELQNAWYYDDVMVTLSKIKPDTEEPGKKKLLEFTVEGSVANGESLSLSIGERSAEYEHVVPNSAIREDNNGKFILIIEEKSTPFGNRYKAKRVDVEVVASDEINTAVMAELQGYEYVITTSNQPVEAGDQVRLNG